MAGAICSRSLLPEQPPLARAMRVQAGDGDARVFYAHAPQRPVGDLYHFNDTLRPHPLDGLPELTWVETCTTRSAGVTSIME